jgi:hypothetical protein
LVNINKKTNRKFHYLTPVVNLDVTTLLAMVSSITHDVQEVVEKAFDSKPLVIQRQQELRKAILPDLLEMFDNRTLVTCHAAFQKCKSIVEKIGGPKEKSRCASLFAGNHILLSDISIDLISPQPRIEGDFIQESILPWRVTVISDKIEDHIMNEIGSKIKGHNLHVIGAGSFYKISTITSNIGLKRGLEMNRDFGIEIHEPRGLIEQKWIRYSKQ